MPYAGRSRSTPRNAGNHAKQIDRFIRLSPQGYETEVAPDGERALQRGRSDKWDLILLEVMLPKLDGLALCRTVKNDPALRHIVMLVFSILAVQSRANEAGADAFLMKPLAEKRLVETVRQLLLVRRSDHNGVSA